MDVPVLLRVLGVLLCLGILVASLVTTNLPAFLLGLAALAILASTYSRPNRAGG